MRPILALNCLLQIEQESSEEESSVGDALALAFRCARFCSASLILFASYSPAPLSMRPRNFVRSCAICSHDSVGMLKSLREALSVGTRKHYTQKQNRNRSGQNRHPRSKHIHCTHKQKETDSQI